MKTAKEYAREFFIKKIEAGTDLANVGQIEISELAEYTRKVLEDVRSSAHKETLHEIEYRQYPDERFQDMTLALGLYYGALGLAEGKRNEDS